MSESTNKAELKANFEQHMLDGDRLEDCSRTMLSADHVFEYLADVLAKETEKARVDENQRYLDKIEAFKNREPVPGELTATSFGSAGAGMVEAAYKTAFTERIAELTKDESTGGES